MSTPAPLLHIIAGPNGAGKTSLYEATIRRMTDAEFVNADRMVAAEIGMHAVTAEQAKRGQELANLRRAELMAARISLVTESTFSHTSKLGLIEDAKGLGYEVIVYHVNVDSADLAVARVGERQGNGGHPVPEDRIRGRYQRNRDYIRRAVLMADLGFVFDNSVRGAAPRRLMTFVAGRIRLIVPDLPMWANDIYGEELAQAAAARS